MVSCHWLRVTLSDGTKLGLRLFLGLDESSRKGCRCELPVSDIPSSWEVDAYFLKSRSGRCVTGHTTHGLCVLLVLGCISLSVSGNFLFPYIVVCIWTSHLTFSSFSACRYSLYFLCRGKTLICSWAWLGLKFTFACMLSCFSCVWLFVTLWTIAHQTPLSMEFFRREYCSGQHCPSPGDISDPGIEPGSPALQADSLSSEPPSTLIVLIFRNSCQIYFSSPSQLLS